MDDHSSSLHALESLLSPLAARFCRALPRTTPRGRTHRNYLKLVEYLARHPHLFFVQEEQRVDVDDVDDNDKTTTTTSTTAKDDVYGLRLCCCRDALTDLLVEQHCHDLGVSPQSARKRVDGKLRSFERKLKTDLGLRVTQRTHAQQRVKKWALSRALVVRRSHSAMGSGVGAPSGRKRSRMGASNGPPSSSKWKRSVSDTMLTSTKAQLEPRLRHHDDYGAEAGHGDVVRVMGSMCISGHEQRKPVVMHPMVHSSPVSVRMQALLESALELDSDDEDDDDDVGDGGGGDATRGGHDEEDDGDADDDDDDHMVMNTHDDDDDDDDVAIVHQIDDDVDIVHQTETSSSEPVDDIHHVQHQSDGSGSVWFDQSSSLSDIRDHTLKA